MSKDKQPEIRFPGFMDDWEERKLNEIAEFNPKSNLPDEFEYVDLESVVGTIMISHRTENKEYAPSRAQRLAQKGDIFYQTVRPYQKNNYLFDLDADNYVFSTGYAQIRPHDSSEFLMARIQEENFVKNVLNNSTGTSYPAINSSDLANIQVAVPTLGEQELIGNVFVNIDDTITLHQRKLDLLKETKKGFLQKMFPKNGAKVPEIRFPGFTGEWEARRFNDFSFKTGKKNSKSMDYPAYSVSNKVGLISQSEQFDGSRLDDLEKSSYKLVKPFEFVYNPARINVGSIAYNNLNKTIVVSSLYVVVRMSNEIDNDFILQFIKSPDFIKEVKRNTEGSVREYLFYDNFASIKFPYTSNIEEQKKIGAFFKQLDDTIALHQRKLDLLKETKKGFLQKMFV